MSDEKMYALVELTRGVSDFGSELYRCDTNRPNNRANGEYFGYYHPDEILKNRQALLEAVLKKLEGCLHYGHSKQGEQSINYHDNCASLHQKAHDGPYSDDIHDIRLIFTPPSPPEDEKSVACLLKLLKKETCLSDRAMEYIKKLLAAKDAEKGESDVVVS